MQRFRVQQGVLYSHQTVHLAADDLWNPALLQELVQRVIGFDFTALETSYMGEVTGYLAHAVAADCLHFVVSSAHQAHPLVSSLRLKAPDPTHVEGSVLSDASLPFNSRDAFPDNCI